MITRNDSNVGSLPILGFAWQVQPTAGSPPCGRRPRRGLGFALVTQTPGSSAPALGNRAPGPILVAAALVSVEATLLILLGLAQVFSISGARVVMGVTTAAFFLLYGAGLVVCAWSISRLRSWARAPVVVTQILQLMVAWSFIGGATTPVAIIAGVTALLVLVALFHPASRAALDER